MYNLINTEWRGDIESLRGVCVISVILYNLFPSIFPSGFVGVDAFFTISGYVITNMFMRREEFSIAEFYIGRIKRLTPASWVVLASVLGCSFILNWQTDRVCLDVISSVLFGSNIKFYTDNNDYFAHEYNPSPLLHFWSLSVEEQFYFIYAPLYWCLSRQTFIIVMLLVSSLSFSFSVGLVYTGNQAVAFYLLPFRFWEISIGGFIAMLPYRRDFCLIGFISLLLSMVFTNSVYFPSIGAVWPVLSVCLILISPHNDAIANIAPLRYIGKVSYSLYLWHFPIIIMLDCSVLQKIMLMAACGILSGIYIETQGKQLHYGLLCVMSVALIPAAYIGNAVISHSMPTIISSSSLDEIRNNIRDSITIMTWDKIMPELKDAPMDIDRRPAGIHYYGMGNRTILLVGDSHTSNNVFYGVEQYAIHNHMRLALSYRSSCPFPYDVYTSPHADCKTNREIDWEYIRQTRPETIITSNSAVSQWIGQREKYEAAYRTLTNMGMKFYVIQDNPRTVKHDEELRTKRQIIIKAPDTTEHPWLINTRDLYCYHGDCPLIVAGILTNYDGNHLTRTYSKYIMNALRQLIEATIN
jgi:peptidoglycan/LPS O-acetylase OafA/YrhL